jgi:hypothetical protein
MAIQLNEKGYNRAVYIIDNGLEIIYQSSWEAVKPTENTEDQFIETHTLEEYGENFLGIDTDAGAEELSKYVFPWGDFYVLHVSALKLAEAHGPEEIKQAARKLLDKIEAKTA